MSARPAKSNRVAIVGASTFRGKDLAQVLEDRNFPIGDLALLDASVQPGTLTEAAGEPTFIRSLAEDSFDGVNFAFFAGNPLDASQNWSVARRAGATVIDMTGAVAASSEAIAWIPPLDAELPLEPRSGPNGLAEPAVYISPPAPVIIACTVSAALARSGAEQIVMVLFPPVSERDQVGIEELENQTRNLLAFREIGPSGFDAQVAFNLLPGYGEESRPRLEDIRAELSRDVARYLAGRAPTPAIQLVQAPVFYGYAFAAFAKFKTPVATEQLENALATFGVSIGKPGDPPPSNVSVAGESEIQLSRIEADPSVAGGVWLWGVADSLRLAATNAVRIAEELIAKSSDR
jgi:aspartate-semialdehyde dehydrogenase